MSYDITLNDPVTGDVLQLDEPFTEGGIVAIGGTYDCDLNVTYNYSAVYRLFEFSLRDLHEKTAAETVEGMRALADKLGDQPFENYWAPTPGNAGAALKRLVSFADKHPNGVWDVR